VGHWLAVCGRQAIIREYCPYVRCQKMSQNRDKKCLISRLDANSIYNYMKYKLFIHSLVGMGFANITIRSCYIIPSPGIRFRILLLDDGGKILYPGEWHIQAGNDCDACHENRLLLGFLSFRRVHGIQFDTGFHLFNFNKEEPLLC
jgi:hypothetical protein